MDRILNNAFKQNLASSAISGATSIELDSITDTPGNADYLPDPADGEYNLIFYNTAYGDPASARNNSAYMIGRATSVNYTTNTLTITTAQENTSDVAMDSNWACLYGPTAGYLSDSSLPFVDSISSLIGLDSDFHKKALVSGFYSADLWGFERKFTWESGQAKTGHDGWSIINPDHLSTIGSANWYTSNGDSTDDTGNGCWVREVPENIHGKEFGMLTDGTEMATIFKTACEYIAGTEHTLLLPKGTLTISDSSLTAALVNVTDSLKIKGHGKYESYIDATGYDGDLIEISKTGSQWGTDYSSTADVSEGDQQMIVTGDATAEISVGDTVKVYSDDIMGNETGVGATNWYRSELIKVTDISYDGSTNTTITFQRPLIWDYTTANTAKVKKLTTIQGVRLEGFGLETVREVATGKNGIYVVHADGARIKDIYAKGWGQEGLRLTECIDAQVDDYVAVECYNQDQVGSTTTSYGIGIGACAEVLLKNMDIKQCKHSVTIGGQGTDSRTEGCCFVRIKDSVLYQHDESTNSSIDIHSGRYIVYENCTISGGFAFGNCNATIKNSTLINAESHRQSSRNRGDGTDSWMHLTIDGCEIYHNNADSLGYIYSGIGGSLSSTRGYIFNMIDCDVYWTDGHFLELSNIEKVIIDNLRVYNYGGNSAGGKSDFSSIPDLTIKDSRLDHWIDYTNDTTAINSITIENNEWFDSGNYSLSIDGQDGVGGNTINYLKFSGNKSFDLPRSVRLLGVDLATFSDNYLRKEHSDNANTRFDAIVSWEDVTEIRFDNNSLLAASNQIFYASDGGTTDLLYVSGNKLQRTGDVFNSLSDVTQITKSVDEESDTWTISDESGAGLTLTVDEISYEKVGNQYRASARVEYPSTTDINVALITAPATPLYATVGFAAFPNTAQKVGLQVNTNTTISFYEDDINDAYTNAELSGKKIRFNVSYRGA